MTQNAIVIKLLSDTMAEVVVTRQTACGHSCSSCESCVYQSEIRTVARNTIHAAPGQHVIIASQTSSVFKAVFLVYVLPLVLFLSGYLFAYRLGAAENICILISFLALILSAAIIIIIHNRFSVKQEIQYEIIS